MEDVVVHYHPGSAVGTRSLLETTEKLLEPFPCRTPPVFTPWFPPTADLHLPIRPAKPAPVITCTGDLLPSDSRPHAHTTLSQLREAAADGPVSEQPHGGVTVRTSADPRIPEESVSETPNHLLPSSHFNEPETQISRLSPDEHRHVLPVTNSPRKRSWSVFTQRGVLLQSPQSLSKPFHHAVSKHRLHLRQRAKWVISQDNCGGAEDIEQVWRSLSRLVRTSSRLPSCNANIQREQAEIWVFCDVLQAEQVGRFLKEELQLAGRISLSVHRLGNIFSM
ncbi:shieldin complex subunit 3 [Notolabrus celidotus]|uniref:shieldin complex subunit 3 n=1 Tax=Notolabrus celidotus TaxID=1203425 RepID=UPI00148FBB4C|nr:shieldin complex subunit 3 [Notolabrus celidotus]XP_034548874.1 shieldin complex subunit 3 [Notolabrus celidotus]